MMPSLPQLLIVLAIVVVIFGLGKFPKIAGDLAKGIKSFKKGMKDDEPEEKSEQQESISKSDEAPSASTTNTSDKKDA
ncbi:TatABCE protein translocation system subunit [Candidatus Terasakiella magnetica]|uniref:Sec-independent protein translocase protein TatA n=1 Tax=Candidatus Terasakiella magnetica TaxID=1867952 RepID=A0A1C3RCC0_9PROT|nr:twin-arginine translocase TatA/TatE family subunit [Candidatus Terasakiella magnetica]SCA54927.1 TatABCE protein translocation system subunit [Candidatus Terasakiella magnetica]